MRPLRKVSDAGCGPVHGRASRSARHAYPSLGQIQASKAFQQSAKRCKFSLVIKPFETAFRFGLLWVASVAGGGCQSGDCTPRRDAPQSLFCQMRYDRDFELACLGLSPGEVCGRQPQARVLRCTADARCTCGNGALDAGEECDRSAGMQGCSDDCRLICASDAQCSFLPRNACRSSWACDTATARCVPGPPLPPDASCGDGLRSCDADGQCASDAPPLQRESAPSVAPVVLRLPV